MSEKYNYYEFPKAGEKFIREDGSCDLLLGNHPLESAFIRCGLEDPTCINDERSLQKLKDKLELSMHCLLLKREADSKKALKAIEDEFFPLIEELQYCIDKQSAMIHLKKRYDVVLKDKE